MGRACASGNGEVSHTTAGAYTGNPDETTSFLEVCCDNCLLLRSVPAQLQASIFCMLCCSGQHGHTAEPHLATANVQDVEAAAAAAQQEAANEAHSTGSGSGTGSSAGSRRQRCELWWLLALPAAVMLLLAVRVRSSIVQSSCEGEELRHSVMLHTC